MPDEQPTPAVKPAAKKFLDVPADKSVLPDQPWTHASLCERYGPEGGEEMYCRVAIAGGYFNPKSESSAYRPDLHP